MGGNRFLERPAKVDWPCARRISWCVRKVRNRSAPINGSVFGYHFVLPLPRYGDRRNVRIAPQTVAILRAARELNDFQSAAQIHVQALLLGFAVERRGAVNQ